MDWRRGCKSNQTVGIVGFGNFGQFPAKHFSRALHNVTVSDVIYRAKEAEKEGYSWASLEEIVNKEVVVLAVPFQNLEQLLTRVFVYFQHDCLVMDVCSVKQQPIKLMLEHLPANVEIVGTHPLFGHKVLRRSFLGIR